MLTNIFKFAWRNIWRNRRRTFFTLVALSFGVTTVIFAMSYISGIIKSTNDIMIKTEVGHVRIAHKEFLRLERILPKESMVTGLDKLRPALAGLPQVKSVLERIKFNVLLSNADINEPGLAVGIEPGQVDASMELSKAVKAGRYLAGSGLELIIGSKLATKLKVTVDDELLLVTTDINYSTYALPFKIVGIFETGFSAFDKHMLFIPLAKAREMLDCGDSAHEVLLYIKDPGASGTVAAAVDDILTRTAPDHDVAAVPWQENDLIATLGPMVNQVYSKILGLIMFIVALVILNTMLMAVMERYHEIGVVKAMGFKNRETFSMIMVEALYIGIIGSFIGGIMGTAVSMTFEKIGINFGKMAGRVLDKIDIPVPYIGNMLYPDFTLEALFTAVVFGVVTALFAVLYPAFKSAGMKPVDAFRSELKV